MITNKLTLKEYIEADLSMQPGRKDILSRLLGNRIVKLKIHLRKAEYYHNTKELFLHSLMYKYHSLRLQLLSKSFCSEIPINCFGKGLVIWHAERIIVNKDSRIGDFCSLTSGVVIAQAHGKSPRIGNNCELMIDSKILGDITIADHVRIGAAALVIKTIDQPNTTWGGVPAKMINAKGTLDTPIPVAQ